MKLIANTLATTDRGSGQREQGWMGAEAKVGTEGWMDGRMDMDEETQ